MIAPTPFAPPPPRAGPPAADPSAASAAGAPPRFTLDGSRELERHLAHTCARIAAGVRGLLPPARLEGLLLGGGYGRGEGGVLATPGGDRPYNDLEFYVCVRGFRHLNELRFGHALHVLGEILTPQAGVEVEFKITSLAELRRAPVSMFSYDLVAGHHRLIGDAGMLAGCSHHHEAGQIPLGEATRLLMNRCSGLLFARERLAQREFTAADADFVRRNLAKAALALGDALLVVFGRYHRNVRERHRQLGLVARLEPLPWLDAVRQHHAAGVGFKLHPERSTASRADLLEAHAAITALAAPVWLWLEGRRLGTVFASPAAYAGTPLDLCPGTPRLRNVLLSARALGPGALAATGAGRHPRARVFRALSLLLWEPDALEAPGLRRRLQRELRTDATTFAAFLRAYRALWSRVN